MISVVLYGRNDSYGYNLHKRAALSLNCIAEVLNGPDDEILFVDYNTPNDFPVFPEAIQDTLTAKARALTRVLRVRPHIHAQFAHRTHLVALEPIARNVAIRRSNPANRWILSTNTDMIFVPRGPGGLTEIAAGLPDGFYHAPRMEIPETLWESVDRTKPAEIIETIRRWGKHLHLDEIVYGSETILYDGPGDFQLCLRKDLFRIQGFHEDMLLGWHVDSNLAARLGLIHGNIGDLGEAVWGYHCDHTRQITPAHGHNRFENDWVTYGERIDRSDLPQYAASWGCAGQEIEEVWLDGALVSSYIDTLERVIGAPLTAPLIASTGKTAEDVDGYAPRHVLPFLIDLFVTERRDFRLAWWGLQPAVLELFAEAWRASGFVEPILCDEALRAHLTGLDTSAVRFTSAEICRDLADAFFFDVTMPLDGAKDDTDAAAGPLREAAVIRPFLEAVEADRARIGTSAPLRRFIAIGAINSRFERLMRSYVGTGQTPYSSRLRHGFVLAPPAGPFPILKEMWLGKAGERYNKTIETIPGVAGPLLGGPWRYFEPGVYAARLRITPTGDIAAPVLIGMFTHYARGRTVETVPMVVETGGSQVFQIIFEVPPYGDAVLPHHFDFQVVSGGVENFTVDDFTIAPNASLPPKEERFSERTEPFADSGNWLPYMIFDERVERGVESARIAEGVEGYLITGPYWPLPSGAFEVRVGVASAAVDMDVVLFLLEVTVPWHIRYSRQVRQRDIVDGEVRAVFLSEQGSDPDALLPSEVRIRAMGVAAFDIGSIKVRKIGEGVDDITNWLDGIVLGPAGVLTEAGVAARPGMAGYLVTGPYWPIKPGAYEASITLSTPATAAGASVGQVDVAASGHETLSCQLIVNRERINRVTIPFVIMGDTPDSTVPIEIRVFSHGDQPAVLNEISVRRLIGPAAEVPNWLLGQPIGPAGASNAKGVLAPRGRSGFVVTGPYCPIGAGRYKVSVAMRLLGVPRTFGRLGSLECLLDGTSLGETPIRIKDALSGRIELSFEASARGKLEFRVASTGAASLLITSTRVSRIDR